MTGDPLLLGVDLGGSGAKAGLFTLDGEQLGEGVAEYRMVSALPGQAEHDGEAWWQATARAIRQAMVDQPADDVCAVGVGCTNGLLAVDEHCRPLRPAIMLWDQRALPEIDRIRGAIGEETIFAVTGNPLAPGAYSLPTILWLKHHEPETFEAAHKLMVPGGYLVGRLTDRFTVDYSRACTTLLFDIRECRWHEELLDRLEIPEGKLPAALPSREVAGEITADAARLTGLKAGTPVVAGCMDTIGASIGSGAVRPGECFLIMGTAGRVACPLASASFDRRFMNCTHVESGLWLSIGAINGVGSSLRWVRDTFAQREMDEAAASGRDVYDLLTAQAAQAPPGSKGLVYLPYIAGERTPLWNPYARGVFFGVTLGHDRSDFLRSVLEGAAFAIRHVIEILETDRGLEIAELRVGGAAARSAVWTQIIADVLGKPVQSLTGSHTEVLGAALLAGVGIGAYADLAAAMERVPVAGDELSPNDGAHEAYTGLFAVYRELYADVEPYFERIASLDLPRVWVGRGEAP